MAPQNTRHEMGMADLEFHVKMHSGKYYANGRQ